MSDHQAATIQVNLDRELGPVDRRIFGGFIEHLGRCIYGGLYEEGSPLSDDRGFRTDVLEAVRGLRMPILRWPGGNFVSGYNWTDGIGPIEERPARPELAWHTVESNRFGTDEFIAYCREIEVEPYICVNMGTGTMDEARAWVEYCNGTADTYWANQRRKNGHDEPFNVKYWGLGNEMYGAWQIGALSAEDYAARAIEFAKVMKWTDPSIELISCGQNGWQEWDRIVLERLAPHVRYHSIHLYTGSSDFTENVLQPHIAEYAIDAVTAEINRLRIDGKLPHDITIAYDEWNVWFRNRGADSQLEERYDLSDALAVATYLNIFIRKARMMGMANLAQLVNVIAPIFTSPEGMFRQTIYHPLALMAEHTRDIAVDAWSNGPSVELSDAIDDDQRAKFAHMMPFSLIDVAASRTADCGAVTVSMVNRSATEPILVDVGLGREISGHATIYIVTGSAVGEINDFGHERIAVQTRTAEVSGGVLTLTLEPHSHTVATIAVS